MRLKRFTNVFIILLSLSAIYLTCQLWFETLSSRNFFYSLLSLPASGGHGANRQKPHILKPYRFIINNGTSNFNILYDGLDDDPRKLACDKALEATLGKGEFSGSEELNWNSLLSGRSYVFDYSFSLPAEFFAEVFGRKTVNIASKVKAIDAIIITPSRTSADSLTVRFIDRAADMAYAYSITSAEINGALFAGFDTYQAKPDGVFYVSSVDKALAMFTDNEFVPQWMGDSLDYRVTRMKNPYAPKGDLILNTIQPNIEYLFDSVVYSGLANGVYTFSDENTVVRYYPNDVLEYADYHIIDKAVNPTMASNYRAALLFLEMDATINNEYYLSGIEQDDSAFTFYFDYSVNGYPLKLPDSFVADTQMKAPIIITAENNNVFKYKKLVYNFYADGEYDETATISFIDSYNSVLPEGADASQLQIDKASLAYKMEKGKYLRLHWYMDINGVGIWNPAQFKRGE